jgi:hypothetical protein
VERLGVLNQAARDQKAGGSSVNLKAKFKPRAEAPLLSQLIQTAWQDYQDQIASTERQAEVAETIANYFETLIPPDDFAVLTRYNCIAHHDHANVRIYDAHTDDIAKYREAFGIELPRKVPVLGTGGYGYPSLVVCEPWESPTKSLSLDGYFLDLLTARKQYQAEYKASLAWPAEYGKEHGQYPTWGEIAERFPVLGEFLRKQADL